MFLVSTLTLGAIVIYAVLVFRQYEEMIKATVATELTVPRNSEADPRLPDNNWWELRRPYWITPPQHGEAQQKERKGKLAKLLSIMDWYLRKM